MEAMHVEPVADGQQPMTSADVVPRSSASTGARPPPRQVGKTFF